MGSWELVVKDLQGHTQNITVTNPQTVTILDLKHLIAQRDTDMPVFEQRLIYERTELQDCNLLSAYPDIQNGSQLMLIRLIPFQIFVKGMDGSSYTFRIPSKTPQSFSVLHFKRMVQERIHLRPEEQRLQYAGKELVDRMTLGDYNVVNNATLHLVSRLRGGSGAIFRFCVITNRHTSTYSMPCGHAVSSEGLYRHCMGAVRGGKDRVLCPVCRGEWSVKSLRKVAALSESQLKAVDEGLTRNFCLSMPGVITCRQCGTVWATNSASSNTALCSACAAKLHDGKKATVELLAMCPSKVIDHAGVCPSLRACPNCGNVIEHERDCRRVECNRCKTQFCFICLMVRQPSCPEYYPCKGNCATAARQTTITARQTTIAACN